jgi:hypothetical protein
VVVNDDSSKTQLTRELVSAAPARAQWYLGTLLENAGKPHVPLAEIVAACCRVLEDGRVSPAWEFAEAAWALVALVVNSTLGPVRDRVNSVAASSPGEVLKVPAKTHFLIGLILSKDPDPRRTLLSTPRGPTSRYDLGRDVQSVHLLESGGSGDHRLFQLESLLWNHLLPTEVAYTDDRRQDLRGWLEADRLAGKPHFVVVDPGSGGAWRSLAAAVREVYFVEPDVCACNEVFPDEDKLSYLVGDLLTLTGRR